MSISSFRLSQRLVRLVTQVSKRSVTHVAAAHPMVPAGVHRSPFSQCRSPFQTLLLFPRCQTRPFFVRWMSASPQLQPKDTSTSAASSAAESTPSANVGTHPATTAAAAAAAGPPLSGYAAKAHAFFQRGEKRLAGHPRLLRLYMPLSHTAIHRPVYFVFGVLILHEGLGLTCLILAILMFSAFHDAVGDLTVYLPDFMRQKHADVLAHMDDLWLVKKYRSDLTPRLITNIVGGYGVLKVADSMGLVPLRWATLAYLLPRLNWFILGLAPVSAALYGLYRYTSSTGVPAVSAARSTVVVDEVGSSAGQPSTSPSQSNDSVATSTEASISQPAAAPPSGSPTQSK